jgi:hypothetical protein
MLSYMYIDESGDLGENHGCSKYMVITALLVKNPSFLDRIIKNMRRNKFKKQLKVFNELKGNNLKKEIIIYALKKLSHIQNLQIFHIILEKEKIKSSFLLENKHKLYNFVAGKLAKNIILEQTDVEVLIDKSKGKQALRDDFDNYFRNCLREKSSIFKINIKHAYSHAWSGLQFADLLAWSAYQKVNNNNSEYIDIIPNQEVTFVW